MVQILKKSLFAENNTALQHPINSSNALKATVLPSTFEKAINEEEDWLRILFNKSYLPALKWPRAQL
ncbi:Hypothetical protein FKW44_003407, partial [Caligus rogercresseyi]